MFTGVEIMEKRKNTALKLLEGEASSDMNEQQILRERYSIIDEMRGYDRRREQQSGAFCIVVRRDAGFIGKRM